MKSNSQFGPDPSQYNGRAVGAGMSAAGAISAALAVGLVNAMNARALADGRAITVADWSATVHILEMHCQKFDADLKAEKKSNRDLKLENLQLLARLEIALCRAKLRN
jgi:hypothetical protein